MYSIGVFLVKVVYVRGWFKSYVIQIQTEARSTFMDTSLLTVLGLVTHSLIRTGQW